MESKPIVNEPTPVKTPDDPKAVVLLLFVSFVVRTAGINVIL